jgi:hypothetical protein
VNNFPKMQVLNDFLTVGEIEKLQRWFSFISSTPYTLGSQKHLDYHKPGLVRSILKPKIDALLGEDHTMGAGAYKEDTVPHPHHVDNYKHFDEVLDQYEFVPKHNRTLLIPLSEHAGFKTIYWNKFIDGSFKSRGDIPKEWQTDSCQTLDPELISHIDEPMRSDLCRVPIDQIVDWKLGDAHLAHRFQLHASTDFAKLGLTKKFAVFFID